MKINNISYDLQIRTELPLAERSRHRDWVDGVVVEVGETPQRQQASDDGRVEAAVNYFFVDVDFGK